MANSYPKTLVIIPALNEEESIAHVIGTVRSSVPHADIAVLNDGSSDRTGEIAEAEGAIVLHLPHNVGIGASVQTGFKFADHYNYDIVVRSDGDGQHTPEDIPYLIRALDEQQADLVIGSRYLDNQGGYTSSAARRAGSLILARLIT